MLDRQQGIDTIERARLPCGSACLSSVFLTTNRDADGPLSECYDEGNAIAPLTDILTTVPTR